jgi:hypothetical protein
MSQIKMLLSQLATRIIAIGVAAASAALLAYFRSETSAGIKWLLGPIVRSLPWRHTHQLWKHWEAHNLTSELTVVDVFLTTANGRTARYEKTADYVVKARALSGYREGVTASGRAHGFTTALGIVEQTKTEHGFYLSQIDLGARLVTGTRFRNVYRADLLDCFLSEEEHWTQEIALPSKHLTLRVHFPSGRPPKLIRCKRVVGLTERQISTETTITELFGQLAVVWEIQRPTLGDIYKLEWVW